MKCWAGISPRVVTTPKAVGFEKRRKTKKLAEDLPEEEKIPERTP